MSGIRRHPAVNSTSFFDSKFQNQSAINSSIQIQDPSIVKHRISRSTPVSIATLITFVQSTKRPTNQRHRFLNYFCQMQDR